VEGSELGFANGFENVEALGGSVDLVEAVAGGRKCVDVLYRSTREEHLDNQFRG
jgi:hypothetical protein